MGLWHRLGRRTRSIVSVESIRVQGFIIYFQKETSFTQNQPASHWPSLVCFISPPLLNGFQSSLISLESYCQGESNAVCYEGQGLLLLENVGNYRNCTTWIILEPFGISNPDLSFLDIPPYD